jgi:hypothetical protein
VAKAEPIGVYRTRSLLGVGDGAALTIHVIEICLVAFGALLLLGSMGAFFLYIPFLPVAVVVAILLGMALAFLLGVWMGSTRILRLRSAKRRVQRLRLRRDAAMNHTAPSDEKPLGVGDYFGAGGKLGEADMTMVQGVGRMPGA